MTAEKTSRRKAPSARKQAEEVASKPEVLSLSWDLFDLPSSQHRAGLAGLVLLVRWLERLPGRKGLCRLDRVDAASATLSVDRVGMQELFDEVYGATLEEAESRSKWKGAEPLRTEERATTDAKTGKTKKEKVFVYRVPVPRGAFLPAYEGAPAGERPLWTKLWRDMLWSILRGVPAQRRPYEARAEGEAVQDGAETWDELAGGTDAAIDLPSTYFLGAQQFNAEGVSFRDRRRSQLLLHFWPFVAQVYVPNVVLNDGKREFVGYAIAIPDVADLATFCDELPEVLRAREREALSYRPRAAVIDLPLEAGLDWLGHLRERVRKAEARRQTHDLVLAVDLVHAEKQGNNVRLHQVTRLDVDEDMLDEYGRVRHLYWDPSFRRQRIANVIAGRPWYAGFDRVFETTSSKLTIGRDYFRRDARTAIGEGERMNDPAKEGKTSIEDLVYQTVRTYLARKLKDKYHLEWEDAKKDDGKKRKYEETKEDLARKTFLAVRARTGADFVSYFASTLCSVPQWLDQARYRQLSTALLQDTDNVRTLTLLALSANG